MSESHSNEKAPDLVIAKARSSLFSALNEARTSWSKFVIGWPADWWLSYYSEFAKSILERFNCLLKNDRIIVIALLNEPSDAGVSSKVLSLPRLNSL